MLNEMDIDFEWFRCPDGYSIVRKGERYAGKPIELDTIVPNSSKLESCRPVGGASMLFDLFLRVDDEQKALKFVRRNGSVLAHPEHANHKGMRSGDTLYGIFNYANFFRRLMMAKAMGVDEIQNVFYEFNFATNQGLTQWRNLPYRDLGSLRIVPLGRSGIKPRVYFSEMTDVFYWQACLKINGVTSFASCRHCGCIFERGPGTPVRADATFCKSEHSVLYHSHKRRKGA